MTLLELNYQRRKTTAEAGELLDAAVLEHRSLTLAEQARFDSLTARIHEIDCSFIEREAFRKAV
jgi:hypothetical protein